MRNFRRYGIDLLLALMLFAGSLAVFNATLTPSLSYKSPDGNELATVPYGLGLVHSTGYPLYTWLGKLFTFLSVGDVAHRMNLMSAILGAGGVALLYLLLVLTTGKVYSTGGASTEPVAPMYARRLAALFAALLFAFSLTFWSQTGIAEVYTPNVFMMTLTLFILLIWAWVEERGRASKPASPGWRAFLPGRFSLGLLFIFGLVYGLSHGTHMSNLGFAPAFALFILLVSWQTALSPAAFGLAGLGFLLGLAQFLWLPYKANSLNDPIMLRHAPSTLQGIYNYTLGAFPQFKFAFAWWQLPERIVLYEVMLRQQYGLAGIALGLYGMAEMVWRRPKRFFLFVGMYLFHVWFFIQYRAFDLDVFFIPAHLIYAIFIGFGATCLLNYLGMACRGTSRRGKGGRWVWLGANLTLVLLMALAVGRQVQANWTVNDYSDDTAINDFYTNVWEILPSDSVLMGQGGVFGYDMFYWRLVYNVRPDVTLPMLTRTQPNPRELAGRPTYTTVPGAQEGGRRTPWSPPEHLVSPEAWYAPVLVGAEGVLRGRNGLTLYRMQTEPPQLVVAQVSPQFTVDASLDTLRLVGFDLASNTVEPGERLELTFYWQTDQLPDGLIATALDERLLEAHELGLGNLPRYLREVRPAPGGVIIESYAVVVPSTLPPGEYPLTVSLQKPWMLRQPTLASSGDQTQQSQLTLTKVVVKDKP